MSKTSREVDYDIVIRPSKKNSRRKQDFLADYYEHLEIEKEVWGKS